MSLGNLPLSEKKKPQKRLNNYIRDLFFLKSHYSFAT